MLISRHRWLTAAGLSVTIAAASLAGGGSVSAVVGETVDPSVHAFTARVNVGTPGIGHGCSGALVAASWVLTSRACLSVAGVPAATGAPAQPTTVTAGRTVDVAWVVPHPDRDVALLRTVSPLNEVTPVALATAAPSAGDVLQVVGYGRTATMWVPDRKHLGTVSVTSVGATTIDVVGTDPDTTVTCRGDLGGPTLREVNGSVQLVGIHLSSSQHGCLDAPETSARGAVETRVDDLAGWIRQNSAPVLVRDFNGDGKSDIIGRYTDGVLRLYTGNGTGGINSGYTTVATSWANMSELFSPGDFNGDGKPDIIGRYTDGVLRLYTGNGTGGINPGYTTVATAWTNMSELFSPGDFNGDGKPDIIGRYSDGTLRLYTGNGTGGINPGYTTVATSWANMSELF
ncbi:FG-GAP-like repeat-containing protein [Actinoplanes sp. G11-F43]|uniref:FG-GAP-like repeat-containing protein n=1 Tax=Actinoplanes sp. G11-F43 TaxID=3424130 RepID=UPI003D33485C